MLTKPITIDKIAIFIIGDDTLFLYSFAETIRLAIKYSKFTDSL